MSIEEKIELRLKDLKDRLAVMDRKDGMVGKNVSTFARFPIVLQIELLESLLRD